MREVGDEEEEDDYDYDDDAMDDEGSEKEVVLKAVNSREARTKRVVRPSPPVSKASKKRRRNVAIVAPTDTRSRPGRKEAVVVHEGVHNDSEETEEERGDADGDDDDGDRDDEDAVGVGAGNGDGDDEDGVGYGDYEDVGDDGRERLFYVRRKAYEDDEETEEEDVE
jgi:hypothetical protein